MKLTRLQKLAESTDGEIKVRKYINPIQQDAEDAFHSIESIMKRLHSGVLADMLKQEDFPETESKAAKEAAKAAFEAIKKLSNEIDDLHMALGMHFEEKASVDRLGESEEPKAKRKRLPIGLPAEVATAIKSSVGVAGASVKNGVVKVSVSHHNGYMTYDYTLKDGELRVNWHGYQSPGGDRVLVKDNKEEALATLVKKIKSQAKAGERSEQYKWA